MQTVGLPTPIEAHSQRYKYLIYSNCDNSSRGKQCSHKLFLGKAGNYAHFEIATDVAGKNFIPFTAYSQVAALAQLIFSRYPWRASRHICPFASALC